MVSTLPVATLASVLAPLTQSGSWVAPHAAQACVARLRKGHAWSVARLASLTGLDEAAARVAREPALVVERRGALRALSSFASSLNDEKLPWEALAPSAQALRALVWEVTGTWDPVSRRAILIAPNVLDDAVRDNLDQGDWSRWVALKALIAGTIWESAPFLLDALRADARALGLRDPQADQERACIPILIDAIAAAHLDRLTTRDLSSLGWIRSHRAHTSMQVYRASAALMGIPTDEELDSLSVFCRLFAQKIVEQGNLPLLVSAERCWPTLEELADYSLWEQRVAGKTAREK